MVGLVADRPLESNFLSGLLEGLLGSLGIAAPGEGNPPTSSHEGAGCAWSTAMREAISQIEQKEVEAPGAVGLPPNLNLCYQEDFLKKQRHLVPPIFLDPLFIPKMAKAVFKVVKPPVVLKALPPASSHEVPSTPHQPGDSGLELEVPKLGESTPSTSQTPPQVQEQNSGASDTDSGKADETFPEEEQSHRSLKVKLPLGLLKRSHKATTSGSKDGVIPSKVWKESEAGEAETTASTGPSEAVPRKARFELYEKDLPEVQEVCAQIFQSDREYVIHQLHEADCLSQVTIYYGENLRKQIAFCPYCGVMNENTATTYIHARKHLGITFLCGGCYSKLYKAPQHLSQHMKSCPPCLMNRPEGSRRSVRKK